MWPFKKSDYRQGLADGRIGVKNIEKYASSAEYKRGQDEGWEFLLAETRNRVGSPRPADGSGAGVSVDELLAMEWTGGPKATNLSGRKRGKK